MAARDRDQAGLETQQVGEDERHHAEHRIGDDVEGDEQAVVPPYHRWPAGALHGVVDDALRSRSRNARARNVRRAAGCALGIPRLRRGALQAVGERVDRGVRQPARRFRHR